MKRLVLTIALLIASVAAASAQQAPPNSPIALSTPKIGSSIVAVAPPNPHRAGLYVFNPSNAVPLWVAPAGTPAAVSGAGSIMIQPGQGVMFGPPGMPPWTNGMNAIASTGDGSPISVLEY